MGIKILLKPHEHVGAAIRRLKRQCDKSGLFKELRKRECYQKPSEARRRAEFRKKQNAQKPKVEKPAIVEYY